MVSKFRLGIKKMLKTLSHVWLVRASLFHSLAIKWFICFEFETPYDKDLVDLKMIMVEKKNLMKAKDLLEI